MQLFSFLSKYFRRSVQIFPLKSFFMSEQQESLVLTMEKVFYANILDMTNALENALNEADILEFTKEIHRELCTNIRIVLAIEDPVLEIDVTPETMKSVFQDKRQKMKLQLQNAVRDAPTSDLCEIYQGHVFNLEYIYQLLIAYETRHQCQNGDVDHEYRKAYSILIGLLGIYLKLVDHLST
jgi:hypothetical protein